MIIFLSTAAASCACFSVGCALIKEKKNLGLAAVFFFLSGAILAGGSMLAWLPSV